MQLKQINKKLVKFIQKYDLTRKWEKSKQLFENNHKHPSLNTELLEPHWRGIYSFRIDKKYRALFFITNNNAEVFKITNHYKK